MRPKQTGLTQKKGWVFTLLKKVNAKMGIEVRKTNNDHTTLVLFFQK